MGGVCQENFVGQQKIGGALRFLNLMEDFGQAQFVGQLSDDAILQFFNFDACRLKPVSQLNDDGIDQEWVPANDRLLAKGAVTEPQRNAFLPAEFC